MKDYLNINEAAKACGVSIPTIRTKLERNLLPNAHQVQEGQRQTWRIPLSDLIAAGLLDKVSKPEPGSESEQLKEKVRDLELRLERVTAQSQTLEAQLREQLDKSERQRDEALAEIFYAHRRQLESPERRAARLSLWNRKPKQAQEQSPAEPQL